MHPQHPDGPSLLVDLRPCYDGFAGIPQETRLLFSLFSGLTLRRLGGLASGTRHTSRHRRAAVPYERVVAQTQALISQDTQRVHWDGGLGLLPGAVRRRLFKPYLAASELFRRERLDQAIDPGLFGDYLWTRLFERTLPAAERDAVLRAAYFATELGHDHARSLGLLPRPFQRRIDTEGWDAFFAATVSPYRVARGTTLMVRYYDALPLLSPHTLGAPWRHALSHARMLQRNMVDGAEFFCASEPVRGDVLRLFPHAERRVHTIPVTVAPEFQPDPRPEQEVRGILARRLSPATRAHRPADPAEAPLPRLFMAVSTLEPRKNYLTLFRAFTIARAMTAEPIQLLIVANPGWRSAAELAELTALVRDGAYHVEGVPTAELRALYCMAHCLVAPSRAEGFGYAGVEAMACGTPVIASDIAVHRWVYGDAAQYADAHDAEALARLIAGLAELPRAQGQLAAMRDRGLRQARLYRPAALMPRWEAAIAAAATSRVPRDGAAV